MMPISKKRKTRSGKPVRYQPPTPLRAGPPPGKHDGVLLDRECLSLRVELRGLVDVPIWWGGNAYRSTLPARVGT